MHNKFLWSVSALLAGTALLSAAEIPINCKFYSAKIDLKGGKLTELVRTSDKQILTDPKQLCFVERLFVDGKPAALSEELQKQEYKFVSQQNIYPNNKITLSVDGTTSFDYIRVTKTYNFIYNKPSFTVDYTLENLSDKARPAGLWVKTTFTNYDSTGSKNRIWIGNSEGKLSEFINPGNAITDNFFADPKLNIAAISGVDKKTDGCVISFTPGKKLGGTYAWLGAKISVRSIEYLTRELDIPARGKVSFSIKVDICNNVEKEIKYLARLNKSKIKERIGRPLNFFNEKGLPGLKYSLDGVMKKYVNTADFTVARQANDCVRSVRIPGNIKLGNAAVYEVYNGKIEHGNPLATKVKKLADGSSLLLFKMPGCRPGNQERNSIVDNMYFDKRSKLSFGKAYTQIRVVPDSEDKVPTLEEDDANLLLNGSFDKFNKDNTPVIHNNWMWGQITKERKTGTLIKESKDGSYCLKLKKNGKNVAVYTMGVTVEPGRLYKVSADIRCDNLNRTPVFGFIQINDKNGKYIPNSRKTFFSGNKGTAWNRFSGEYMMPANAAFLNVGFQLHQSGPDNVMWVDNVSIRPADFEFVPKSKLDLAKEAITRSGYPIEVLEKISHELVTPHEKWFKPAASVMPDMLYLPIILHNPGDVHRRNIVEMAQRMDFKYEFIPLLPKSRGSSRPGKGFGVYNQQLEDVIDDYVFVRLEQLKSIPKVTMVQGLDFALYDKNKRFTNALLAIQKKSNLVFVDCKNIPAVLTGKKLPLPESWKLIPLLNPRTVWDRHIVKYEKASVFTYGDVQYIRLGEFPSTPLECRAEFSPSYVSRDFPFWEYRFLPLLKAVREAGNCDTPAVFTSFKHNGNNVEFTLDARREEKVKLLVNFKSFNRFDNGSTAKEITLKKGANQIALPLPVLPGGKQLAYFYLLDSKGGIYDAGAMNFATPEKAKIAFTYPNDRRILPADKTSQITISCDDFQAGDKLFVDIEDTEFRIVKKFEFKASKSAKIDFKPELPRTLLYRILARLERNGKVIARSMGEVSVPVKLDPTEFHAGFWAGRRIIAQLYKNLGFDMISIDGRSENIKNGLLANGANLNMYPLVLNMGLINNHNGLSYRSDRPSDPVRNPCYSDEALNADTDKKIGAQVRHTNLDYYAGFYHMLGDEQFLGSMVCYSEHCLKNFRKELAEEFKTIDALNKNWNTKFKSFDEVVPMQLDEAKKHGNLAPWLSHKVFMAKTYAHKGHGTRVAAIKKYIPGAQVGLSGTQIPGYGYDWAQLMKHFDFLAFYSGIQRTLVCDFAPKGAVMGEWGGGYVGPHALFDAYQRSDHWSNLLKGANACFNWHGGAILGDGTPSENLKAYADEFNLLKSGVAKLLLTSEPRKPQVAILYSQSSLFAAMGSEFQLVRWMNTQTGWDEMLRDLKYDAVFITYEQLADSKFDLSNFKAIILPMALSLSGEERARLVAFAKAGGTVIADAAPGRFDKFGARVNNTVLDELFPGNAKKFSPLSRDVNQADLKSRFLIAEPDLPVYKVTKCGKGQGVLFNIVFDAYQTLTLGGIGGESSTSTTGTEQYCTSLRNSINKIFSNAGIKVYATVKDKAGKLVPSESVLRKNGENYYFGLIYRNHAAESIPGKIDVVNAHAVTVELPVSGVIYDVRKGRKIAVGNKFKTTVPAGYGQLFAVLPAEITKVNTYLAPSVKAGDIFKIKVSADGAASNSIFRMELISPDGKKQALYNKNIFVEGKEGEFEFQLPYNAPKGRWNVMVKHVASGKRVFRTITVR